MGFQGTITHRSTDGYWLNVTLPPKEYAVGSIQLTYSLLTTFAKEISTRGLLQIPSLFYSPAWLYTGNADELGSLLPFWTIC